MRIAVIEETASDLAERRAGLLAKVHTSEDELRRRVGAEAATAEDRAALETLDEIAFLLAEDAGIPVVIHREDR